MICTICHRHVSTIIGSIENKQKDTKHTRINVLYRDSTTRLVCSRCQATNALVLSCNGEPVVVYYPVLKKFLINGNAVKTANREKVHFEEEPSIVQDVLIKFKSK